MGLKATREWLNHSGLKKAQEKAVRLCAMSHAVLPLEKTLRRHVSEQILSDVIDLALNIDFVAQQSGRGPVTVGADPLWPASARPAPEVSLQDISAWICKASVVEIVWETPNIDTVPYRGHGGQFASTLAVKSDQGDVEVSIGAMATAFFELLKDPASAQAAE